MRKKFNNSEYLWVLGFILFLFFIYSLAAKDSMKIVKPAYGQSKVFRNMSAVIPAETARTIVQHSKRPKTLAAIAAVETGKRGHVTSKGSHGEIGIFQVREKDWGFAGRTTLQQVLKADKVLDELVKECNGDEHKAIKRYNGSGAKAEAYRRKVYAQLRRMNTWKPTS